MSNSLDPDQAQRFVGPDLGPNCCKGYQQTTLVGKELVTGLLSRNYCGKYFGTGGCNCTDEYVECKNEHFIDNNITLLYHYIKDDVTSIKITGSNLSVLPQNLFGACAGYSELVLQKLNFVDLTDNYIQRIHGKTFHCMPNITHLILKNNQWQVDRHENQTGYFTSLPVLQYLDLTNALEEMWNGSYHIPKLVHVINSTNLRKLETIRLAENEFYVFNSDAADSLCHLPSLKFLDLSHNNLESPVLKECMTKLKALDLSYNMMPVVSSELRGVLDSLTSLREVRLDNNMFYCDCGFLDTYRWLRVTNSPVLNKDELRCFDGYHSSYINKTVLSLQESDLKCDTITKPSSTTATVLFGLLFGIIACIVIFFMIVNREYLKTVIKRCKKTASDYSLRTHAGYSSVTEMCTVENI